MALKKSLNPKSCRWLATLLGLFLLAGCSALPFERVDYKAYPTAQDPGDFFGRVYTRTRLEEVKVHQASSAEEASQQVGFPVRLPAYLPDGLEPVEQIISSQSHAYQVDIDLSAARLLLDSANLPTGSLPGDVQQIKVDATLSPAAVTSQGSDPRYVTLIQTTKPTLGSTSGVDPAQLDALGILGWQSLGLTEEQAQQINQEMGWAFFLALPPAGIELAEVVDINGITGIALQSGENVDPNRAILWENDGVLYGVYSNLPLTELQMIAGSLE